MKLSNCQRRRVIRFRLIMSRSLTPFEPGAVHHAGNFRSDGVRSRKPDMFSVGGMVEIYRRKVALPGSDLERGKGGHGSEPKMCFPVRKQQTLAYRCAVQRSCDAIGGGKFFLKRGNGPKVVFNAWTASVTSCGERSESTPSAAKPDSNRVLARAARNLQPEVARHEASGDRSRQT